MTIVHSGSTLQNTENAALTPVKGAARVKSRMASNANGQNVENVDKKQQASSIGTTVASQSQLPSPDLLRNALDLTQASCNVVQQQHSHSRREMSPLRLPDPTQHFEDQARAAELAQRQAEFQRGTDFKQMSRLPHANVSSNNAEIHNARSPQIINEANRPTTPPVKRRHVCV